MAHLRDLWKEVCETEQRSSIRNEKLLRQLDELEECVLQMSVKSDQMRRVREHYLRYGEPFHNEMLTSTPMSKTQHLLADDIRPTTEEDETFFLNETQSRANHEMRSTVAGPSTTPPKQNAGSVLERVDSLPPSGSRRSSDCSGIQITRRSPAQLKNAAFVHEETFSSFASPMRNTRRLSSNRSTQSESIKRKVSLNVDEVTPPPRTTSRDSSRRNFEANLANEKRYEENATEIESKVSRNKEQSPKRTSSKEVVVSERKNVEQVYESNEVQIETTSNAEEVLPVVGGLEIPLQINETPMKETQVATTSEEEDSVYDHTNSAFVFEEKILDMTVNGIGNPLGAEESSDEDDIERQMSAAAWTTSTTGKITNSKTDPKRTKSDEEIKQEPKVAIQEDKVDPHLMKKLVERMGLIKKPLQDTQQVNKDEDDEFDFYD